MRRQENGQETVNFVMKKTLVKTLVKTLIIILGVLFSIIIIAVLLSVIFSVDGYLTMGFSFLSMLSVAIVLPTIILLFKYRKNIVTFWRQGTAPKVIVLVFALIFIMVACGFSYPAYQYFKDMKEGPQEAIMTNVEVKRKHRYRGSSYTYIVGDIDGVEVRLKVTRDARSEVKRGESYEMLKVVYYKNIGEVFEIDEDVD